MFLMKDSINAYYTPTEVFERSQLGQSIQLGGLVEEGSVVQLDESTWSFNVTDEINTVHVIYRGILPALFRDGQGIIASGLLQGDHVLSATRLLAKHDEYYRPPGLDNGEVAS